jgi:spore maturation protein CgeB
MDKRNIRVLFLSQAPLIKYGLKSGFDKLGCETSFLDDECYAIWEKPQDLHRKLIFERIDRFKPDLIFSEGYATMPLHEFYPVFKSKGIQTHLWDIEADCTPQIGECFVLNCDYFWTTMGEKIPEFKQRGLNIGIGNLLFGCNPDFHKPTPPEDRFKHDLSLVARNYSNRYKESGWFVMPFLEKQYDLKIYGLWWNDTTRPINLKSYPNNYWQEDGYIELPYEWLPIVINSSKVILGMNVPVNSSIHCSMRPFETLASSDNSILLGHYQEGQYKIFGDYMYHAKNTNEAIAMTNEILSMTDEQRREKARLAREFVIEKHNYTLRAKQVLEGFYKLGGLS